LIAKKAMAADPLCGLAAIPIPSIQLLL